MMNQLTAIAFCTLLISPFAVGQTEELLDPAAWGDDHTNKPLPDFVTGDECLFCHRGNAGGGWHKNKHNLVMSHAATGFSPTLKALLKAAGMDDVVKETVYVLGGKNQRRFLKPNGKYGQYAIHNTRWTADGSEKGTLTHTNAKKWDNDLFANKCIGCHTTLVDPEYKSFAAPSTDCLACHGDTPQGHQNDATETLFNKKIPTDIKTEISTCFQCHARGGVSKSTGLPYPNKFIPRDNLFKDFQINLSEEYIAQLNPADQHIYANVRDVVLKGNEEMSCTTCHDVHGMSSRKHRILKSRVQNEQYCITCHEDLEDFSKFKREPVHSEVCEY
jgi:predicted CXXCH cytochrome family protein